MFNVLRHNGKTMKKLLYSVFALAGILAVSCTKEEEAPVAPVQEEAATYTTTIQATIGEETRTAYENFKKFSWLAQDEISVFTYNEEEGYYRISTFTAQEDGVTTTFTGEVENGYIPGFMAVYPDNAAFINGEPSVFVPSFIYMDGNPEEYYTATSDNPLSNLILVGSVNEAGTAYSFKTAMGAIKLSFSNLPEGAAYLRINAPEKISGYFYIDEDGHVTNESAIPGSYKYTDSESGEERTRNYSNNNIWYHFTPDAEGNATLYIPLPVGKLSAGTTFYIEDEDEDVLFQKSAVKDIVVERNKVTELVTLATEHEWVSIGKGKYLDNYLWNLMEWTEGQYVEVEIFRDAMDPTNYRIASPYGAAATAFKYKLPKGASSTVGPEDMDLSILPGDLVNYKTPHNTGIIHPNIKYKDSNGNRIETQLVHPGSGYLGNYDESHNTVIKYQENGLPAIIQLAPIYWWMSNAQTGNGYWSGGEGTYSSNDVVRILFPGASDESFDLDASTSFIEIVDDTPENPIALVNAYLGIDLAGGQLVVAKDLAGAKAAFASGTGVKEISVSGEYEVALPANAATGEYFVYLNARPVDGLAIGAGLLATSEAFKYYSSLDDRQLELSSVLGLWTASEVDMFFNPNLWDEDETNDEDGEYDWQEETFSVSFYFEESDDEEAGDVMLTGFEETGVGFCGVDTPIYGRFDTAHGLLTFDAHQPIYSFTDEDSGTTYGIVFEDYMNDSHDATPLTFELSDDLTKLTMNFEYFTYSYWNMDQDSFGGYSNIIMYSPVPEKAEETASAAPKRMLSRASRGNRARMHAPERAPLQKVERTRR